MTNQLQPPLSYHIDPTIYAGRPADSSGRLPKELRTYDLLDSLHISYERVDHDALPTIEACRQVDEILGTPHVQKPVSAQCPENCLLSSSPSR